MSEITVTLAGHVASEVTRSVVLGDVSVTKFRMAAAERRYDRELELWRDVATSFVTVTCWRSLAENVALSLRKGHPIVLHGRLRVNEWANETKSGREVEIEATYVGHDLSRGTSLFTKVVRERPDAEERSVVAESGPDGESVEHDLADADLSADEPGSSPRELAGALS